MRMVDTGLMTVIEQSNVPTRMLRAGEVLYRQGDPADAFYLVRSGILKEIINDFDVNEVGPRFLLGIDQFGVDANGAIVICNEHRETVRAVEASVVTAFTAAELTSMFLDPQPESRSVGPKLVQWFGKRFAAAKLAISMIRKQLKEVTAKQEENALELSKANALLTQKVQLLHQAGNAVKTLRKNQLEAMERELRIMTERDELLASNKLLMDQLRENAAEKVHLEEDFEMLKAELERVRADSKDAHTELGTAQRAKLAAEECTDRLQKTLDDLVFHRVEEEVARRKKEEEEEKARGKKEQEDLMTSEALLTNIEELEAKYEELKQDYVELEKKTQTGYAPRVSREIAVVPRPQRLEIRGRLQARRSAFPPSIPPDATARDLPAVPRPLDQPSDTERNHSIEVGPPSEANHEPVLTLHIEDDPTLFGDRPEGLDAVAPAPNPFDEPTGRIGLDDIEVVGSIASKKP